MTNPKTFPVAESVDWDEVRAAVAKAAWPKAGLVDEAMVRIRAAMPRPIEDDTPTDAGEGIRLAALIEARLLGVPFDERDLELEDQDFRLIIAALRTPTDTGPVGELVEALEGMVAHTTGRWAVAAFGDGSHEMVSTTTGAIRRARTALSKAKESL